MPDHAHPESTEWLDHLADALEFYRDVGLEYLVLTDERRAAALPLSGGEPVAGPEAVDAVEEGVSGGRSTSAGSPVETADTVTAPPDGEADEESFPRASAAEKAAQLAALREEIGDCVRCKLSVGRTRLVFGEGNPDADLMFVGEGPGQQEDLSGRPFVGRAGQLLDRMIAAMTLRREDVFIANVVKCRPPDNRTPENEEVATCTPFLVRQIEIIQPRVIVCLGRPAACFLFGVQTSMGALRGSVGRFRGARLLATYHPAYLLRNPAAKRDVWEDLQKAMKILGLKVPGKN